MLRYFLHFFSLLIFTVGVSLVAPAQTSDSELAQYYYRNGEFEKAVMYFERIYDAQPNDANYGYLLQSYIELEDFKTAEKLIKRQAKLSDNNSRYLVDLGLLYASAGDPKKAQTEFDNAIQSLGPNQRDVISLATHFIKNGLSEQAMATYERGKKLLKDAYPFNYEMASLYGMMGDFDSMIDQYLTLLEFSPAYLQTVQNALNRYIDFNEDSETVEMLRIKLLKKVQRAPDSDVFAEMLIWFYTQKKSFNSAFIQVKAIDMRKAEDGQRVMNLAKLCITSKDFATASKCYEYVLNKEPRSPYYMTARMNLVSARKSELENNPASSSQEFYGLESLYKKNARRFGPKCEYRRYDA